MYLKLDTRFNPFTYDEMMKPLLYYNQAYNEAEAAYSELSSQTESLKNMIGENSPKTLEKYLGYSNRLSEAVSDFSNGMTAKNRKELLNLKRNYAGTIVPIALALKRRQELADKQLEIASKDPTMLWEKQASNMSIDDIIDNPSINYGKSYSGSLITKAVSSAVSSLAKEAQESELGKIRLKRLLPFQYEYIENLGFSAEAIDEAIRGSENAPEILTNIVNSVIDSTGVGRIDAEGNAIGEGWGDANTRREALRYARLGLYDANGGQKSQILTDSYGMNSQLYKDRLTQKPNKDSDTEGDENLNRNSSYNRQVGVKVTDNIQKHRQNLQFLEDIVNNPNILSETDAVSTTTNVNVGPSPFASYYGTTPKISNYTKLSNLGKRYGVEVVKTDQNGKRYVEPSGFAKLQEAIKKDIKRSIVTSDVYISNHYNNPEATDALLNRVISGMGIGSLDDVWEYKGNGRRGDRLSKKDLENYKGYSYRTEFDKDNRPIIVFELTDNNGKHKEIEVGTKYLDDVTGTLTSNIENAQRDLSEGEGNRAQIYVGNIMDLLNNIVNGRAIGQSGTSSSITPITLPNEEDIEDFMDIYDEIAN